MATSMFVQTIPAIFEHRHRRDLGYFASASNHRQEGQVMQTLAQRALSSHDLGEDDAARQLVPGVLLMEILPRESYGIISRKTIRLLYGWWSGTFSSIYWE